MVTINISFTSSHSFIISRLDLGLSLLVRCIHWSTIPYSNLSSIFVSHLCINKDVKKERKKKQKEIFTYSKLWRTQKEKDKSYRKKIKKRKWKRKNERDGVFSTYWKLWRKFKTTQAVLWKGFNCRHLLCLHSTAHCLPPSACPSDYFPSVLSWCCSVVLSCTYLSLAILD